MLLSLFEHHPQHHSEIVLWRSASFFCFNFVQSKKGRKMPKRGWNKSRKISVGDGGQITEIDQVLWKLARNWKEMRRQMRKHYLSKKSFTYEIYAETLKAAHKIFQQKVCLLSGSVLFFMTCSSLHGNYGLTPSPPNVDRSRQRKTRVIFQGRLQLTSARHTPPPHVFWPRSDVPRSTNLILVPTVQNKQGYHLGKWRGHTLRIFRVTAVQSWSKLINLSVEFSNAHQTEIHTEMKLLKTYLVAEARVCEFGLFGG